MPGSENSTRSSQSNGATGEDRLGSWKEIANYLGRTVRTVQRWEKTADLPIRRVQHQSGSSIFAFRHELDQWLRQQSLTVLDGEDASGDAPAQTAERPPSGRERTPLEQESPVFWKPSYLFPILLISLVAIVIYELTHHHEVSEPLDTIVPALLTTSPGTERFPALSPDGRQVVYSWDGKDGQVDLFLKLINADGLVQITDDEFLEEGPSWSPDGLSIAFVRHSGPGQRELRIVSPLGGADRLVTRFEVPISMDSARSISVSTDWSPDGRWIALTASDSIPDAMGVVLWDVHTGEQIRLTDPAPEVLDLHPRFSPDGERLAFTRSPSSLRANLMMIDLDWTNLHTSSVQDVPGATAWNSEPEWTIDGQELLFSSGRWPRTGLWRAPVDGSASARPLTSAGQGASHPTLVELPADSDGSEWRLVYSVNALDNDIWVLDLQGNRPASPLLSSSQRERFPSYAQDGRIAFLSDRSGHREIWVSDEAGVEWRQWTDWHSAYIWSPVFSPDGKQLAYSVEIDGVLSAHVQDGPLEPAKRLFTDRAQDNDLAWSRDGSRIYASSLDRDPNGPSIWTIEPASGNYRQIHSGPGSPLGEDPTGEWLLIAVPDGVMAQLARVHLERGEFQVVAFGDGDRHSMTPGPGGVYFVEQFPDGSHSIRRWSYSDGQVVTLLELDHEPEIGLAISPDGQWALLARIMLQRGDLMMADG